MCACVGFGCENLCRCEYTSAMTSQSVCKKPLTLATRTNAPNCCLQRV